MATQQQQQTFDKKPNEIFVSANKQKLVKDFINITKSKMGSEENKNEEHYILTSLGEATNNAVQTAAKLVQQGWATIVKIDNQQHQEQGGQQKSTKQKLVITLKRSSDFIEKYSKQREESQKKREEQQQQQQNQ
ncbi:hypothetical protein PPERSA_11828 [Pseudocohnilembus persalinus]|uniref:DNA/RNA-binding protein Alba-like domain-containing protein n=1 Tax=Pseudocohnilembus persalinus TaxID=266149 RepID=A0A0V0QK19_PSEPJ|nr:hypothetical protein PPERSA_11828 [Pseudocohnilembus persalinus]|eukprot:KRX02488.1 hypothetical protein PPERSA_11828 [Pseudocohnilembus persalinus]